MLERSRISVDHDTQPANGGADANVGAMRYVRPLVQAAVAIAIVAGSYVAMERMAASKPERMPRTPRTPVYTIETATVERTVNRPSILLYGTVDTARSVDLRAAVGGDIIDIRSDLAAGRRVTAGSELLRIDPFAYEGALLEAEANLAASRAARTEAAARLEAERDQLGGTQEQLELARSDLDRALSLQKSGTLTGKQVEDRQLILSQRELAVLQRRNNIAIAEAQITQQDAAIRRLEWKVEEARRRLADTVVRAPFDGVISAETAEDGRSVNAGEVIVSLYDDTALEVRFTLTNAQYGRVAAGEEPLIGRDITLDWTVGGATYRWPAVISRIGARVAAERGGVEVFAAIGEAAHPVDLRPGAFVALTVPDRAWPDTVRLPETAVRSNLVFVVTDGKLEERPVTIIAWDGEDAIVTGDLKPGEKVMTTRLTEATTGLAVREPGDPAPQTADEPASGRNFGTDG